MFDFDRGFVFDCVIYMSYGGVAKSMFSNRNNNYGGSKSITNSMKTNLSASVLSTLRTIESNYTANLANKSYSSIPSDYVEYSKLYSQIAKLQLSVMDSSISILLKITQEGLKGAMNALGLSNEVLEANVVNIALNNQVNKLEVTNSILEANAANISLMNFNYSDSNQLNIYSNTSGQYQITKTFTLIPLYSYYILLYGLPAQDVGFDPLKIKQLLGILEANNIDPYHE